MNNNLLQMLQMFRGKNPQMIIQMLSRTNPQVGQMLSQYQNMAKSNNMTAEQLARQLAKQNGLSDQDIMQIANMLSIKK